MKKLLLILLTLTLTFAGCHFSNSRENMIKRKELQTKQSEPERKKVIEEKDKEKQKAQNDSLVKTLLGRYPTALKSDSIEDCYTYYIEELLEKSSDLLFIEDGFINDIESRGGPYIITINSSSPEIIGKFEVNQQLSTRLLKEVKPRDTYEDACLVVKVSRILPIKNNLLINIDQFSTSGESNGVSADEIRKNVHIGIHSGDEPFYYIKGEVIDFYLLKE